MGCGTDRVMSFMIDANIVNAPRNSGPLPVVVQVACIFIALDIHGRQFVYFRRRRWRRRYMARRLQCVRRDGLQDAFFVSDVDGGMSASLSPLSHTQHSHEMMTI